MAIKCGTLSFFSAKEDQGRLIRTVGPVLLQSKNKSIEKIYNDLITALKNQNVFKFGEDKFTSKQLELYQTSLNDLKQELIKLSKVYFKNLTPTDISKFNTLIEENLYSDGGLSSEDIVVIEEPSEPEIEGIDQETEDRRNSLTLNNAINRIYGTSFGAAQQRDAEFGTSVVKASIIDTDNQIVVTTIQTLNESIGRYKNSQYRNIVKYLNSTNSTYNFGEDMFDSNGVLTKEFYKVMNLFFQILENTSDLSDVINNQWMELVTKGINNDFLSAVNSFINLQYFDNLLQDKLGKAVALSDIKLFGSEIDLGYNKYTFGKADEHKVKHWGTNEQKDAISNIAKFSKLVLSTIKINSSLDGKFQNKYVNIQNFSNAITHLFSALNKSNDRELATLKATIHNFHSNPYYYSKRLFKQLSENGERLIGRGFSRLDLDILSSMFDQVYNTENPNSIISIETKSLKKNFSIDSYSIIDSINGVIDRTMEANYLQVTFDKGTYRTSIKKKYASRKDSYSLVNKINTKNIQRSYLRRKQLTEQYPIIRPSNNHIDYEIQVGNNIFTVKAKEGILSAKSVSITCNNPLFNSIFKGNSVDIDFSYDTIKRIISGTNLNAKEQLFRDTLQFIDSFLDLDLLSENGLNILNIYRLDLGSSRSNYIEDILQSAIRSAAVNNLYKMFQDTLANGEYVNNLDFERWLDTQYFVSSRQNERKVYFSNYFGTYVLKSVDTSEEWIDKFIEAEAILSGEISKSTTKDLGGNSLGNYRTSFLGGNIFYYLNKYQSDSEVDTAAKSLMFTGQPNLIKDIVINTDAQARSGEVKRVRDMKPAELFYMHIIHNFYGAYLSDSKNSLSGCFVIQPTTYSDKVTPINYAIDGNILIKQPEGVRKKSYHGKSLAQLTTDELIEYYQDTIGASYKATFNKIIEDYRKLFNNPNMTIDEIQATLKNYDGPSIVRLAQSKGMEIQEETHYRKDPNGGLKLNELLYHYAYHLHNDIRNLKSRLAIEKVEFLNDLLDSGISFYANYSTDTVAESNDTPDNPIRKIINSKLFSEQQRDEIKTKWIKNGKLILAKVNGQDILMGKRIQQGQDVQLNPILEKYFYTDLLLSNNLRDSLTGTEGAHPDKAKVKIANELAKEGITLENAPAELIEFDKNGNPTITSNLTKLANSSNASVRRVYNKAIRKIEAVAQGTQFKRNVIIPATLQYVQQGALNGVPSKVKVSIIKDTDASTWNFRGDRSSIDAHDGSAWENPLASILLNKSLQDQEVGVDKKPIWHHFDPRTNSATLLKYATFTMTNERMRTSLLSDISLYNLFKKMTDVKWFENGECRFQNPGLDSGSFNEAMSKFNLMTTLGFKSSRYARLDFKKDVLQDKQLYYKQDAFNHRLIVDFGYDEKGYYTLEKVVNNVGIPDPNAPIVKYYHKFDSDSNHYRFTEDQVIPEELTDINSLFQLYNALGGVYSESLVNDQLVYSDQSLHATVNFMNNVSVRVGDSNDMSQRSYWQPLKDMMIYYAANSSAVKVGASNVNPSSAWGSNDALTYMTLDTDGLGIQMDADHDIDEAEMTEFSQVISALEAGGRLHEVVKDVYSSLGKLALQASSIELDAVNQFIDAAMNLPKDDSEQYERQLQAMQSAMYDVIGKAVINNYKPNNERVDLAKPIIDEISKLFNTYDNHTLAPFKLAFSDSNLYSTILSTFMSNLNKKSIKRKYPGSGCVMVPGYGIIQIFKINGIPYQFDDVVKAADKFNHTKPFFRQFDSTKESITSYNTNLALAYLHQLQYQEYQNNAKLNLDSFIPTDVVDICIVNPDETYTKVGELNFNEIDDYYQAKINPEGIKQNLGISPEIPIIFAQNLTKPRNLAPARITWSQNGKETNIFDTEEVANSFGYSLIYKQQITPVQDRKAIQKVFDDLDKGKYRGQAIQNFKSEAAELVMSNLYASPFGLNPNSSLQEIINAGPTAFKISKLPVINVNSYEMCYTTNTNENLFFTFRKVSGTGVFAPKKRNWRLKTEGNKVYHINKEGEKQFQVGAYVTRPDLSFDQDGQVFRNMQGEVVSNSENTLKVELNGEVLQYYEYISRYDITEKINGKLNTYQIYQINKENIQPTLVVREGREGYDVNNLLGSILASIYSNGSYTGIRLNDKFSRRSAAQLQPVLDRMASFVNDRTRELIQGTQNYLQEVHTSEDVIYEVNKKINGVTYNKFLLNYYNSIANDRFASFLKSLKYTSSRIPAQTLQSFMQMKLVGFTANSKNVCYVSHWQTYLQGSDYRKQFTAVLNNL